MVKQEMRYAIHIMSQKRASLSISLKQKGAVKASKRKRKWCGHWPNGQCRLKICHYFLIDEFMVVFLLWFNFQMLRWKLFRFRRVNAVVK